MDISAVGKDLIFQHFSPTKAGLDHLSPLPAEDAAEQDVGLACGLGRLSERRPHTLRVDQPRHDDQERLHEENHINMVVDRIYLGDIIAAQEPRWLDSRGVTHVVDLANMVDESGQNRNGDAPRGTRMHYEFWAPNAKGPPRTKFDLTASAKLLLLAENDCHYVVEPSPEGDPYRTKLVVRLDDIDDVLACANESLALLLSFGLRQFVDSTCDDRCVP